MVLALYGVPAANGEVRWGLGRWQGRGTFLLDWEKQDDKRADTKYETILFQERFGLRNVGAYVVDPRFLTLNLGGSFGLSQEEKIAVTDNPLRVGNGTLYDYAFDGYFLSDSSHPVSVFANRNENNFSQGFGGRSDVTFASHGGVFELREGNFLEDYGLFGVSSLLDVHQELLKEDSAVFGSPFKRDETRNIVRYTVHRGGQTSDFDLRYELNDVNDPLNPSNVFDSNTVRAVHSLDFGPTLNRRLDSVLYYFTRSGSGSGDYVSLDEGLHIDHLTNFATDYRYNFSRSDSDVGVTTTHNGSIGLLHRLYRLLTTTLDARATRQDFPDGDKTIYGGQMGVAYHRSLPWQGQLFAHTFIGYEVDDNNFTSSEIDVVDEPHTAPAVIGAGAGFALNNTFVLEETIVMFDVRGGARLPTTLNVDYTVRQEGAVTTIIPLAGSPVIQPNDPLEVSYTYEVDPTLQYSTATVNARAAVEFPWFAVAYEHTLSNQSRLSGTATPQFLIDENLDVFTLELRHRWNQLRAQSTISYEILNSTIIDSRTWRFGQLLSYQPRLDLTAQISGDQYFIDFPGEDRRSDSHLVRATVDWFAPIGAAISPFAGYRAFHDTGTQDDEIVDVGVRMRWTYRNLEISPSFSWSDYRRRLNDVRAQLQITRHFF